MADYIIATELDAHNIGGGSSYTSTLGCRKDRASALGCSVGGTSAGYSSNQLVRKADLSAAVTVSYYSVTLTVTNTDINAAGTAQSCTPGAVILAHYSNGTVSSVGYDTYPSTSYGTWSVSTSNVSNGFTYNTSTKKYSCSEIPLGPNSNSVREARDRTRVGTMNVTYTASSGFGSVSASATKDIYQEGVSPILYCVIGSYAYPTTCNNITNATAPAVFAGNIYVNDTNYGSVLALRTNAPITISSPSWWHTDPAGNVALAADHETLWTGNSNYVGRELSSCTWGLDNNTGAGAVSRTGTLSIKTATLNGTYKEWQVTVTQAAASAADVYIGSCTLKPMSQGPTSNLMLQQISITVVNNTGAYRNVKIWIGCGFDYGNLNASVIGESAEQLTPGTMSYYTGLYNSGSGYLEVRVSANSATTVYFNYSGQTASTIPQFPRANYLYGDYISTCPYFKIDYNLEAISGVNVDTSLHAEIYTFTTSTFGAGYKFISGFTYNKSV